MAWTFDNAIKLAIRTYTNAPATAATEVRTQIGSGWKLKIRRTSDDVEVATGTAVGSLGGTGAAITGSVTLTFSQACDPATTSYYARIEKSDATRWLRGTVGLTGTGSDVTLTKAAAVSDTCPVTVALSVPTTIDPAGQFVVAINCGGNAYTDASGIAYLADIHFSAGTAATVTDPIAGTTDDPLYQTERWGAYSYTIPVTANKNYRVTLKFCEIFNAITAAGQRVFDVKLEPGTAQEVLIDNLDIYAQAGALNALDITRDVLTTDGTLTIQLIAGTQNPKLNAILVYSPDGGVYVPPTTGGGGSGEGDVAWIKRFKTDFHDARLGKMPTYFDWHARGRPYDTDTILQRRGDAKTVPWNTIFAAGDKEWPQSVGVEVGASVLSGRRISDGVWVTIYSWPTHTYYKHNRDDYGADAGVAENFNTAPTGVNTERSTNAGTKVVKRANNASFPQFGTHIHGYFEGPNSTPSGGSGRVSVDKNLYHALIFRSRMRAVGYPSADGLAPITNPAGNDGTSIVGLVAADTYSADGDFASTYGGDIGIARAIYITNDWQTAYWFTCLPSYFDTYPPPWV